MKAEVYKNAWLTMEANANPKEQSRMKEYLYQAMQEVIESEESEEN